MPGFEYQYKKCEGGFIGIGKKCKTITETYDLRDAQTRDQLIAMGFVALVEKNHQ